MCATVRQRIQIPVLLFLCIIATGAQWDLVQVFAWGRMMATHSLTMPLAKAVTKTFDGEMCPICRMVAKAKEQERSRSGVPKAKIESKVLLFFQTIPEVIVEAPRSIAWYPSETPVRTVDRLAPPLPPPRVKLA